MLLAGRVAEQELASVLYQNYAAKSAIFLDEYQVSARVWLSLVLELKYVIISD